MIDYLSQLKSLATQNGIDLEEACEKAGVNQSTLWRWENKETHPSYRTALRIYQVIAERQPHAAT